MFKKFPNLLDLLYYNNQGRQTYATCSCIIWHIIVFFRIFFHIFAYFKFLLVYYLYAHIWQLQVYKLALLATANRICLSSLIIIHACNLKWNFYIIIFLQKTPEVLCLFFPFVIIKRYAKVSKLVWVLKM